jgi:hypothetical protein
VRESSRRARPTHPGRRAPEGRPVRLRPPPCCRRSGRRGPPNIFFSVSPGSPATRSRMRWASSSLYAMAAMIADHAYGRQASV